MWKKLIYYLNVSLSFRSSRAKRNYLKEPCTEKIFSNLLKQTDKINRQLYKKNCSKSFSDDINCPDIEEEIIKQINMLKPFDMETRKAIPKKSFYRKRQITVKRKLI